jgi:hypothetical protein
MSNCGCGDHGRALHFVVTGGLGTAPLAKRGRCVRRARCTTVTHRARMDANLQLRRVMLKYLVIGALAASACAMQQNHPHARANEKMASMRRTRLLSAVLVICSGCFNSALARGLPCSPSEGCPDDQTCEDGTCVGASHHDAGVEDDSLAIPPDASSIELPAACPKGCGRNFECVRGGGWLRP